jgi:hypothetical protein
VAGAQHENANANAALLVVGLSIFWPALIGMATNTHRREELGRLRGEYAAVDTSMRESNCAMPAQTPAMTPAPQAASTSTSGT